MSGIHGFGTAVRRSQSAPVWTLVLIVVASLLGSSLPAAAFSAAFSWRGIPACATISPRFSLSGVPTGTVALAFLLRDRDAPGFDHGGSTVPYRSRGVVAKGAVTYTGPCPPQGDRHRYVWTVDALDAKNAKIGTTDAAGIFPP